MKIIFFGDIVSKPGRNMVSNHIRQLKAQYQADICIANGENAAAGQGIQPVIAKELFGFGVHVITTGNHAFYRKDILRFLEEDSRILRPANFPKNVPGQGWGVYDTPAGKIGVINLLGRVYMNPCDCPFQAADRIVSEIKEHTRVVFVDFHAEATSEKVAMARYLNGRVSCVAGTHTHVQTADETILDRGTAYITDVGMTGPSDGVIGIQTEIALRKFTTWIPEKYEPAQGASMLNGIFVEVTPDTGKAIRIERIQI